MATGESAAYGDLQFLQWSPLSWGTPMSAQTHDTQDDQRVICYRRGDYALRLVLHGLRVYATGLLFYPLCGTGYVPVITWHPPVWWASEARSGFQLLDAARQADPGFAE